MNRQESEKALLLLVDRVKHQFVHDGSGHGLDHIQRVYVLSRKIAAEEGCNEFVVSIAALLHDVGDYKLSPDQRENHASAVRELLRGIIEDELLINEVIQIVEQVSFKGNGVPDQTLSREGQCVRDADRLDAMGAIGVARAFAYGALKKRPMYNPEVLPGMHSSFKQYQESLSPTINHFYEKLLLLRDRMETPTGKKMAEKRHVFLESFLREFVDEWDMNV